MIDIDIETNGVEEGNSEGDLTVDDISFVIPSWVDNLYTNNKMQRLYRRSNTNELYKMLVGGFGGI